ncbi:putative WD repeat protein 26 [Operophtera brumata]|uniref:Putative WD repeat protein 26 n=1 Tax=Operophtera brumata TaxID=104452 RepID=A0A0L7L576_OPEBR|nr:putative WD repeat protein 26 [Operophtera brumata]
MEESGLHLEHPAAATFRAHVLAGDWSKADHDLRALHDLLRDTDPRSLAEMKFAVLEQKYLEHLEVSTACSEDSRYHSLLSSGHAGDQ